MIRQEIRYLITSGDYICSRQVIFPICHSLSGTGVEQKNRGTQMENKRKMNCAILCMAVFSGIFLDQNPGSPTIYRHLCNIREFSKKIISVDQICQKAI